MCYWLVIRLQMWEIVMVIKFCSLFFMFVDL